MKRVSRLWFVLGLGLEISAVAQADDFSTTTIRNQIVDWSFIQSVGGIQVGQAFQQNEHTWKLSLFCDLSGQQTFSQKPTLVNSNVVIQKMLVQTEDKNIVISLAATKTVWTSNPARSQCTYPIIESKPGVYQVLYRDGAGKTYPIGIAEFKIDSPAYKTPG